MSHRTWCIPASHSIPRCLLHESTRPPPSSRRKPTRRLLFPSNDTPIAIQVIVNERVDRVSKASWPELLRTLPSLSWTSHKSCNTQPAALITLSLGRLDAVGLGVTIIRKSCSRADDASMASPAPRHSVDSLSPVSPSPTRNEYPFPRSVEAWGFDVITEVLTPRRPGSSSRYQPRRGSTASSIHSIGGTLDTASNWHGLNESGQNGKTRSELDCLSY
jgi:hypothetical protein